jgi:CelD/BcsL family acetyltransferase involved in cellulose biosynthesis
MHIEEIRDYGSLQRLRADWSALVERTSSRNPFVAPQFMLHYLENIGTRYDCRVLIARENERLIGFSPTFIKRSGRLARVMRRVSFPTHGTPPPLELVVEDGRDDVVTEFVQHWKKSHDWDLIELQNVPATSETEAMIRTAAARTGLRLSIAHNRTSLYVPVVGTWEQYWRSIPKKSRAASNRSARLCAEAGELSLVAYPGDQPDLEKAIDWVNDITRRSWKTSSADAGARSSMETILRALGREGILEIRFALINQRPVAYLANILYKQQLNAFHTAYDLTYMPQGPTVLLLHGSIQECFRLGYERYDLLGERQLHVRRWSSTFVQYSDLRLTRDTPLARLRADLYFRVRAVRMRRARQLADEQKEEAKSTATARRAVSDDDAKGNVSGSED